MTRLSASVVLAGVALVGVTVPAFAGGHDAEDICHPKAGGYVHIRPDKASAHFDQYGNPKHEHDGRVDVYAVGGFCPGESPTPSPTNTGGTPSTTSPPQSTPTSTATSTATSTTTRTSQPTTTSASPSPTSSTTSTPTSATTAPSTSVPTATRSTTSPPTSGSPTTASVTPSSPTAPSPRRSVPSSRPELARTGSEPVPLALLGGLATGLGILAMRVSRRRRAH